MPDTKSMRAAILILFVLCSYSCSESDALPTEEGQEDTTMDTVQVVIDPIGLHRGVMPCADCPGIATELWLRPDGNYLKLQTYLERDTMPFGEMGTWEQFGNEVLLTGSPAMRFRVIADGLRLVAHQMDPTRAKGPADLLPSEGDLLDRSMRITGSYTYAEESHSMRPCGTRTEIPLGMQQSGLEMAMWYTEGDHDAGKPLLVQIQAHLGMGPSMEGDGEEEYLFVEKVLRRLDGDCPSITSPL